MALFIVFLLVFFASSAGEKFGKSITEEVDGYAVERMEASSVVATANYETNDTTIGNVSNETMVALNSSVAQRPMQDPFRFGPWEIFGLQHIEDSWVCELRQAMRPANDCSINTLSFILHKGNSLKLVGGTQRCGVGCEEKGGEPRFRVVVSLAGLKDTVENNNYISCLMALYFQTGVVFAMGMIMAAAIFCFCSEVAKHTPANAIHPLANV